MSDVQPSSAPETIVLGGGCFWCTETIVARLPGVLSVIPGYAGGTTKHPTYTSVSGGKTGHAEVIKVLFDPQRLSLARILAVFFAMHDPTSLNQQGNDVGTQYRSIVLWTNEEQQQQAEALLEKARAFFDRPIVTEIKPLTEFFPAEEEHHEYYARNPSAPYCTFVIKPKLDKLATLLTSSSSTPIPPPRRRP